MTINLSTIRQRPAVSQIRFLAKEREQTLYVSQWLWARQAGRLIDIITQNQNLSSIQDSEASSSRRRAGFAISSTKLSKDKWGFGSWNWDTIVRDFQTEEKLYAAIKERRVQICRLPRNVAQLPLKFNKISIHFI